MPARPIRGEYERRRVVVLNESEWGGLVMVLKRKTMPAENDAIYTVCRFKYRNWPILWLG